MTTRLKNSEQDEGEDVVVAATARSQSPARPSRTSGAQVRPHPLQPGRLARQGLQRRRRLPPPSLGDWPGQRQEFEGGWVKVIPAWRHEHDRRLRGARPTAPENGSRRSGRRDGSYHQPRRQDHLTRRRYRPGVLRHEAVSPSAYPIDVGDPADRRPLHDGPLRRGRRRRFRGCRHGHPLSCGAGGGGDGPTDGTIHALPLRRCSRPASGPRRGTTTPFRRSRPTPRRSSPRSSPPPPRGRDPCPRGHALA